MNGAKMKIRIGRPSCTGAAFPGASLRPDSQTHSLLPIARSLTRPGMSAQNHPNRLASGRATRRATGPIAQVIDVVNNSAAVILWYEIPEGNCSEHTYPHNTGSSVMNKTAAARYRHHVLAIRKSGFLPEELVGNPETRGIDEISRQPGEQELRRDALNQV